MNKTAIRNFAIWARNKLIADVSYKAGLMGLTKEGIADALPQSTSDVEFYDIGTAEPYSIHNGEIKQRKSLVELIRQKEKDSDYATAYTSVIEEVAYTWFNRLIAVRFMEVNDYMPAHIRVLSSETGKLEPDIVTTPFDAELDLTDSEKQQIIQLKNDNKLDECFRMLFIKQCNALHELLPRLFENTKDYTELLLNVSFVDQEGVVYHLVHDIEEDDFNIEKGGQVEIIGWLYQYYNSELKDETFALLKNNVKVTKERIPSATQLFTPDWIVRYMVENSLGRLWIEGHPNDSLKVGWKYYLDEAEQEEKVKSQLDEIRKEYAELTPEDIKIIDPCMGSGHILVYAFDVLMQIYESAGYTQRDAARSILENNIFGLDIDERAAQLAYFAVLMKARQYNRRILNDCVKCNVFAIRESNGIDKSILDSLGDAKHIGEKLIDAFIDAKEYGSILNIEFTEEDFVILEQQLDVIKRKSSYENMFEALNSEIIVNKIVPLLYQAKLLQMSYDVVITNPPYLASGNMSPKLLTYVKDNYEEEKGDLLTVFVDKCIRMSKKKRYLAFMTSYTWMYIATFEKFRAKLLDNSTIESLVQPEYHAFFESANVPICSFVLGNYAIGEKGTYIKLSDFYGADIQAEKYLEAIGQTDCNYKYYCDTDSFKSIPGIPIAFWVSSGVLEAFKSESVYDYSISDGQNKTANNDRFLRLSWEVSNAKIGKGRSYIFYAKGGAYRKWYGNLNYVVDWTDEARFHYRKDNSARIIPEYLWYEPGITWTLLSSAETGFRLLPEDATFDMTGSSIFLKDVNDLMEIMALLNSPVAQYILKVLSSTMAYQIHEIRKVPYKRDEIKKNNRIGRLVGECIDYSKQDWDSFETSWDFKKHPLI